MAAELFDTIQRFLYSSTSRLSRRSILRGNGYVYDADLVRTLCRGISDERDPLKAGELISLLRAIMREDQEEIRIRMQLLAKKYASVITETNAAD